MNDKTAFTLDNPISAGFGTLTYTIVDGFLTSTPITVPPNGSVSHPTDLANAPWQVSAILNGPGSTNPSLFWAAAQYADPNAVITLPLTLLPAVSDSTPSADTGFVPRPRTVSLLDPANLRLVGPTPTQVAEVPKSLKLVFYMQVQTQTNWCWAALTASVYDYYTPVLVPSPVTQCSLANWATKLTNCCAASPAAACNIPYQPEVALAHVKCLNAPMLSRSLTMAEVIIEIGNSKPIGIRVAAGGNVGHALAVVGYDVTNPRPELATIDTKDPYWGETTSTFIGFPQNYHGNSSWTHTFKTQAPT